MYNSSSYSIRVTVPYCKEFVILNLCSRWRMQAKMIVICIKFSRIQEISWIYYNLASFSSENMKFGKSIFQKNHQGSLFSKLEGKFRHEYRKIFILIYISQIFLKLNHFMITLIFIYRQVPLLFNDVKYSKKDKWTLLHLLWFRWSLQLFL